MVGGWEAASDEMAALSHVCGALPRSLLSSSLVCVLQPRLSAARPSLSLTHSHTLVPLTARTGAWSDDAETKVVFLWLCFGRRWVMDGRTDGWMCFALLLHRSCFTCLLACLEQTASQMPSFLKLTGQGNLRAALRG